MFVIISLLCVCFFIFCCFVSGNESAQGLGFVLFLIFCVFSLRIAWKMEEDKMPFMHSLTFQVEKEIDNFISHAPYGYR